MSGPPKFRERDPLASIAGTIDLIVLIHAAVWTCGGLWILKQLYSSILRRGIIPAVNPAQAIGALLIVALSISVWDSPGMLLTAFTVGQFAVTLAFVWLFTHRFGPSAYLRHLFVGVSVLAVMTVASAYLVPDIVISGTRLVADIIAPTGGVAVVGLVFCLSSMPRLKSPWLFWGALSLFGGLLVASRTRGAYVAFAAYLAIGFFCGRRLPVRRLIPVFAALALSAYLMDSLSSATDYLVREEESVETMSDRIPLWQHLTTTVMREAPLTGLGYYAASRIVGPQYNPALGDAHSVFLEILVGGGLLGMALYLMLCTSLLWFALRLLGVGSGEPHTMAAVGLLVVTLLIGVTSSQALQPGPVGFSFWSMTALLPAIWRETSRGRAISQLRLPD
jgi:O-antigen ligase